MGSGSTLFAILSSQISFYNVYHSQQSDQSLHLHYLTFSVWSVSTILPFFLAVLSRSILFAILSLIRVYSTYHYQQSDQGLYCLPFSEVWLGSTVFAILSLIRVYSICHSQSDQGLQYLPFSAIWSGSRLFAILSKQYYQGLHCLPFLVVWSGLHCFPFSAVWSGSTLFAILSSLIRVYTFCPSQQSDQGRGLHTHSQEHFVHYLPF